jgi:hypothetical protein
LNEQIVKNEYDLLHADYMQFHSAFTTEVAAFDAQMTRLRLELNEVHAQRNSENEQFTDALQRREVELKANAQELGFLSRRCIEAVRQAEFDRRADDDRIEAKTKMIDTERKIDAEKLADMHRQLVRDQREDVQRAAEYMRRLEVCLISCLWYHSYLDVDFQNLLLRFLSNRLVTKLTCNKLAMKIRASWMR